MLLVLRAATAVLILAAVVGQLVVSVAFWTGRGDESLALDVVNFLSFFTVESNLLAALALALLVLTGLRGTRGGRRLDVLVLCATTYMVVTGVVYNAVLRGIELPQGATLGWSNEVLHLVGPLWMLVDWLASAKDRDVRHRDVWAVVAFPILWLVYTLVRGPITPDVATGDGSWYPYPFLDPATHDNGYVGVALMCVVVAAVVVGGALALVAVARAGRRRRALHT